MGLDTKHLIAYIAAEVSLNRSKTRLARILYLIPGPSPEQATIDTPLPPLHMLPTQYKDHTPAPLQISVYSDSLHTN
jgi:hypothetical protein